MFRPVALIRSVSPINAKQWWSGIARPVNRFIALMGEERAVDFLDGDAITVNVRDLPERPTIMVPASLARRG